MKAMSVSMRFWRVNWLGIPEMSAKLGADQFVKKLKALRSTRTANSVSHRASDKNDILIGVRMGKVFTLAKEHMDMPIDDYLSKLPADQRQALQSLREVVLSVMPDAEEVISYQVPMFKRNGEGVISMSAKKDYCSLHLMSPPLAKSMADELKKYLKGVTLHFTPDKPLPVSLVKKIVKARLKEMK